MAEGRGLERNLRLYPWHQLLAQTLFWSPIFFLYFSERFAVDDVLRLGAIYYVAVVVLEVPSGWFSDRVSRVVTLRISNTGMALAHALFFFGGDRYEVFVLAEMLLAFGYAFRSGTDTSFHFDTLAGLDRSQEFGEREAWIHRNSYIAIALTGVLGGLAGSVDLRFPYALQFAFCVAALGVAAALREPPRHDEGFAHAHFGRQIAACLRYARQPFLAWLFAYMIFMTTTAHIPWEFTQPYLAAVFGESVDEVQRTPIATGALHAVIAFLGAFAAARSIRLRDRLGVGGALIAVTVLQVGAIVAMALVVHPFVAVLLAARSVQPAVSDVVVGAAIVPRVPQAQRATYQSLHSFAGRLCFGAVLYGLSRIGEPGGVGDATTIAPMLHAGAVLSVVAFAGLLVTARAVRE